MSEKVKVSLERSLHGARKLTEAQIDDAVRMYNSGLTQKAVAEHFGVSAPTMRRYLRERMPGRKNEVEKT